MNGASISETDSHSPRRPGERRPSEVSAHRSGCGGASLTLGKRGVYGNIGAPGTGLSYRSRIDEPTARRPSSRPAGAAAGDAQIRLVLRDNGAVDVLDENDAPLPPRLVRAVREQHGDAIDAWREQQCEAINAELTAITDLHLLCPSPAQMPACPAARFTAVAPREPDAKGPGFLGRLFPPIRRRIKAENEAARADWEREKQQWYRRKAEFEREEQERQRLFRQAQLGHPAAMSDVFQHRIQALDWPRETLIDYRIENGGRVMFVDVDLPEIENLPRKRAVVPSRGLRLSIRTVSDTRHRRHYARHIHGVLFRIIGESFASFPRMQRVVASGFSQRVRGATGAVADEYLISVSVDRADWNRIDFSALERVDPVEALARFDLRRRMTKTGIFTPIEPFAAPPPA